jgi:guanylate kinase
MLEELLDSQKSPLLVVISGPSGVGKDTIVQRMKERGLSMHFVVTATSREQRETEIEGQDYFFVSKEQFEQMISEGELIEHAVVYGEYKGIPKKHVSEAMDSGKDVVMRLDVQGAETIRSLYPQALLIFLSTQNEDELIERLKRRRTETAERLQLRIDTARDELEKVPLFDYYVLNSEMQVDSTVDNVLAIIQAEHLRTEPRKVVL